MTLTLHLPPHIASRLASLTDAEREAIALFEKAYPVSEDAEEEDEKYEPTPEQVAAFLRGC